MSDKERLPSDVRSGIGDMGRGPSGPCPYHSKGGLIMETILEVKSITKTYPNQRGVREVSFMIRRGEVFGFLGPNGAGKTTVMKMMTGLLRADQGTVKLFGFDQQKQLEQAMQRVGALIENPAFYEHMTAFQHLQMASRFYPDLEQKRIDEVLALVDLESAKHERVKGYSTGMKQRLGLAAALLSKPELVLLDEPTNGLDIEGRAHFRRLVQRLSKEERVTFFISSHIVEEIQPLCSRIGLLYDGRLIQEGAAADLLDEHGSLEEFFLYQIAKAKGEQMHA